MEPWAFLGPPWDILGFQKVGACMPKLNICRVCLPMGTHLGPQIKVRPPGGASELSITRLGRALFRTHILHQMKHRRLPDRIGTNRDRRPSISRGQPPASLRVKKLWKTGKVVHFKRGAVEPVAICPNPCGVGRDLEEPVVIWTNRS